MDADLTKLSGPELVARGTMVDSLGNPCGWDLKCVEELARRACEDTREWQRNIERERDGLRAALQDARGTIAMRDEAIAKLEVMANNQRKELHALNKQVRAMGNEICDLRGVAPTKGTQAVQPTYAELRERIAELEAERAKALALVSKTNHGMDAFTNLVPTVQWLIDGAKEHVRMICARDKRIAELEAQLREALHGNSYGYPVTTNTEPAERKAQDERIYGGGRPNCAYPKKTLAELMAVYEDNPSGAPINDALIHLSETLATIKAVEAFADDLERRGYEARASQLREVLNAKR